MQGECFMAGTMLDTGSTKRQSLPRVVKSDRIKSKKQVHMISVLICDDHTLVREGLRVLLQGAEDIEVAGEVANSRLVVREAKRLLPDVVLLDVSMPQLNGMEAARQIAREVPSTHVLMLSAYTDEEYVQRAVEAGAGGFLVKGACAKDLLPAIRATARGTTFFCPTVPKRLLKQWQDKSLKVCPDGTNADPLTSRQAEGKQQPGRRQRPKSPRPRLSRDRPRPVRGGGVRQVFPKASSSEPSCFLVRRRTGAKSNSRLLPLALSRSASRTREGQTFGEKGGYGTSCNRKKSRFQLSTSQYCG